MKKTSGKKVFVLLSKYPDTGSKAFSNITQGYYSHASIGFDDTFAEFYSFTKRGFRVERPDRICAKLKDVPCLLYEIPVSESVYGSIKAYVEQYVESSITWKYNLLGVICGVLHFPFYRPRSRKFCSQFVAEVLEAGNAIELPRPTSLMLPEDFIKLTGLDCIFEGSLAGLKKSPMHT